MDVCWVDACWVLPAPAVQEVERGCSSRLEPGPVDMGVGMGHGQLLAPRTALCKQEGDFQPG